MESKTKYSAFPHVNHQHMEVMLKCFSICSSCAKMDSDHCQQCSEICKECIAAIP